MRTQTEGERRSLGILARSSSLPLWGGTPWSLCRWGRSLYPCIPSKRIEQCPRSRLLVSPTVHLQGPPVLGCHAGPYVPMSHASNRAPRRCRFIQHIISALSLVHQHGLLNCAAQIQRKYSLARALTLTLFAPSQSPPQDSAAPSLSPLPAPSLSPCLRFFCDLILLSRFAARRSAARRATASTPFWKGSSCCIASQVAHSECFISSFNRVKASLKSQLPSPSGWIVASLCKSSASTLSLQVPHPLSGSSGIFFVPYVSQRAQ